MKIHQIYEKYKLKINNEDILHNENITVMKINNETK